MTLLRRTSLASTAFAFALVVWGAIVRINGAGMTCPDWPRCRGVWLPALNDPVFYEFTHRVAAALLTLAIVATFAAAWRARAVAPSAWRASWSSVGLVAAQVVAGYLTIRFNNSPPTVALHLVLGFATFISLLSVTVLAYRRPGSAPARVLAGFAWSVCACAVLAFGAVFAAGYMSASNDGLACIGFPLCNGWSGAQSVAQQIHMDHRFAAYATLAAVTGLWIASLTLRVGPEIRSIASAAFGLAVLQGTLGVLTVVSGLAPVLRSLHEANGALLCGALVTLAIVALRTDAEPASEGASLASQQAPLARVRQTVSNYLGLTKLNVMSLLLFTTLTSMIVAAGGMPTLRLIWWTLLGGALASASSAAINMYFDRDIDALMKRTRSRPIPSGRVAPRNALIFGIVLGLLAFATLAFAVNLLAATLSTIGILYYVFIYTVWLKRLTAQNIVIGGAAGSVPPLVGWAAVTDHIGLTALLLFTIVFIWTPPHFWALALMKKDEYARVGLPMMPAVYGDDVTKRQIIAYSAVLAVVTLVLVPLHLMGWVYLACALILDAVFLGFALWVARTGTKRSEGLMYRYSMLYLALLFTAMAIDRFGHGLAGS